MLVHEARSDRAGGLPGLAERQAAIAIDEEFGVFVFVAVMREIMRKARRCVLQRRDIGAVAIEHHGFGRGAFGNQLVHDSVEGEVQLCGHPLSSPFYCGHAFLFRVSSQPGLCQSAETVKRGRVLSLCDHM